MEEDQPTSKYCQETPSLQQSVCRPAEHFRPFRVLRIPAAKHLPVVVKFHDITCGRGGFRSRQSGLGPASRPHSQI